MSSPDELREQAKEIDNQLAVMRLADVVPRKTVYTGAIVGFLMLSMLIGLFLFFIIDTRAAVKDRAVLDERIVDLEEQVSDLESIEDQSIEAILQLFEFIRANGLVPPEIVIRPED